MNNIIVPKNDNQKFWQNECGLRTWNRRFHVVGEPEKDYTLTAQRSYYWVDKVIIMDENHKVINDLKFLDFVQHPLYNEWIPDEPKNDNVTLGNKKIADFLGWFQEEGHTNSWFVIKDNAQYVAYNNPLDLPFHRDWNYMNQVIDKLENMGASVHIANYCRDKEVKDELAAHVDFEMDLDYYACIVGSTHDDVKRYYNIELIGTSRFEALWNAIIVFIDWFNDKTNEKIYYTNFDE